MVLPLIGGLVSGIGSIAGASAAAGANANATNLGYLNFYLQRRIADENTRLTKAPRTDAEGNTVRFIPGRGFVTELTPGRRAVVQGNLRQEQENLREADARRREREGSRQRRALFDETARGDLAAFRFGPKKSEGALAAKFEDLIKRQQDQGIEEAANALGTQARRSGNSSALTNIVKTAARERARARAGAALGGAQAGQQAFAQQEGLRGQLLQRALASNATASNIDSTPLGTTDAIGRLQGQQNQQIGQLAQALAAGGQAQGGALSNLAQLTQRGGNAQARLLAGVGSTLGSAITDLGKTLDRRDEQPTQLNTTDTRTFENLFRRDIGDQGVFS